MGHYILYSTWKDSEGSIELSLTGNNYKITHRVLYVSAQYGPLYDELQKKKKADEF